MDMIGKIRRLSRRGKNSEREIARTTGLSRNTVAKWLHGEVRWRTAKARAPTSGSWDAPWSAACRRAGKLRHLR